MILGWAGAPRQAAPTQGPCADARRVAFLWSPVLRLPRSPLCRFAGPPSLPSPSPVAAPLPPPLASPSLSIYLSILSYLISYRSTVRSYLQSCFPPNSESHPRGEPAIPPVSNGGELAALRAHQPVDSQAGTDQDHRRVRVVPGRPSLGRLRGELADNAAGSGARRPVCQQEAKGGLCVHQPGLTSGSQRVDRGGAVPRGCVARPASPPHCLLCTH